MYRTTTTNIKTDSFSSFALLRDEVGPPHDFGLPDTPSESTLENSESTDPNIVDSEIYSAPYPRPAAYEDWYTHFITFNESIDDGPIPLLGIGNAHLSFHYGVAISTIGSGQQLAYSGSNDRLISIYNRWDESQNPGWTNEIYILGKGASSLDPYLTLEPDANSHIISLGLATGVGL